MPVQWHGETFCPAAYKMMLGATIIYLMGVNSKTHGMIFIPSKNMLNIPSDNGSPFKARIIKPTALLSNITILL